MHAEGIFLAWQVETCVVKILAIGNKNISYLENVFFYIYLTKNINFNCENILHVFNTYISLNVQYLS